MPRQLQPNTSPDDFYGSTQRKRRVRKPKEMPTINERLGRTPKSHLSQRFNAARSSSDLLLEAYDSHEAVESPAATGGRDTDNMRSDPDGAFVDGVPRRVQKGQINALAKMLSALRR